MSKAPWQKGPLLLGSDDLAVLVILEKPSGGAFSEY